MWGRREWAMATSKSFMRSAKDKNVLLWYNYRNAVPIRSSRTQALLIAESIHLESSGRRRFFQFFSDSYDWQFQYWSKSSVSVLIPACILAYPFYIGSKTITLSQNIIQTVLSIPPKILISLVLLSPHTFSC